MVRTPRNAIEAPPGLVFLIDTNEAADNHLAYDFSPATFAKKNLQTGDYSIRTPRGQDLDDVVVVERKSLLNIVGDSCGENRDRWERCLARLAEIRYRAVVIEADWRSLRGPFPHTRVNPVSVQGSIIAWQMRYQIPFWLAGSRDEGNLLTRRLLLRGYLEHTQVREAAGGAQQGQQGGRASAC